MQLCFQLLVNTTSMMMWSSLNPTRKCCANSTPAVDTAAACNRNRDAASSEPTASATSSRATPVGGLLSLGCSRHKFVIGFIPNIRQFV